MAIRFRVRYAALFIENCALKGKRNKRPIPLEWTVYFVLGYPGTL
jgi:hypothetical protein